MDFGSTISNMASRTPSNGGYGKDVGESLRRSVRTVSQELGGRYFKEILPYLEKESTNARSDLMKRLADDAAVFVRVNRFNMESAFLLNVVRSVQSRDRAELESDDIEAQLRKQLSDHEDSDALESIASQVEMDCFALLNDIQQRFEVLQGEAGERLPNITPIAFLEAFRLCLGQNELESGSRMMLYNSFNRLFLQDLRRFYVSLLESLNRFGVTSANEERPVVSFSGSPDDSMEPWMDAGRNDAILNVELASSISGCTREMQTEIARRAAMVGVMFHRLVEGMSVPISLAAQLGKLRPLIVRAALPMREFFIDANHPLRATVNKVALQAGLVALDPISSRGAFEEIYARLRRSCAETNTEQYKSLGAFLTADEVSEFKSDLDKQGLARSVEFQRKARFWSGRMLFNLASAAKLGDTLSDLLWKIWHIPVARVLKESGREGEQWRAMVTLTDRLFMVLTQAPDRFDSVRSDVEAALRDARVPEDEIRTWIKALMETMARTPPAGPRPIPSLNDVVGGIQSVTRMAPRRGSVREILEPYLVPDTWFQLYDEKEGRRWKKVNSVYLDQGHLSFVGIDGKDPVSITYADFLKHIRLGQTVPFTMPPEDLSMLLRMLQQEAAA